MLANCSFALYNNLHVALHRLGKQKGKSKLRGTGSRFLTCQRGWAFWKGRGSPDYKYSQTILIGVKRYRADWFSADWQGFSCILLT